MYEFSSGFANDILAMIAFREQIGVTTYEYLLSVFDRFCRKYYPNAAVLTREIILDWLTNEKERHNCVEHNAVAVRQLGKFIAAESKPAYILPNNVLPVRTRSSPQILTNKELQELFIAADHIDYPHPNSYTNVVAPVLFRLLYTCGLRPNEGRELKREHVDLTSGSILIVQNKQKKERIVVMSDDMRKLCVENKKKWRIIAADNPYFFPGENNQPYTAQQLGRLFRYCCRKVDNGRGNAAFARVRPYDLRHRFATTIIQRWVTEKRDLYAMLPYLRAYMGHKSFASTEYYIHLLPETIMDISGIDWTVFESLIPEVK